MTREQKNEMLLIIDEAKRGDMHRYKAGHMFVDYVIKHGNAMEAQAEYIKMYRQFTNGEKQ